jgi:hypothetical protein
MAVEVCWYDDDETIILYSFSPNWTWAEFYPVFEKALAMEHSVDHRVDVILDYQVPYMIPPGLIDNLRVIVAKQPPNLHVSVLVTRQYVAVMMFRAMGNIIPILRSHFRIVATLPEALALIERDRRQTEQVNRF